MKSLKITKKDKKVISKSQITFNRLVKPIGTLTNKITKEKEKLKVVYQEYPTQVVPLEQEASCNKGMNLLLRKAALIDKYSPKQK